METGNWLVVIAKPNSERRAEYNLKRQNFEVYLPEVKVRKFQKKRLVWKFEPLFRRYLFVREEFNWGPIKSTFGVASLVMGENNGPARLSDKEINRIKQRQGSDGFIELQEMSQYKPGQKIKIVGGAFDGHAGIFESGAGDRVRALLSLLGGKVQVHLSEKNLAPA